MREHSAPLILVVVVSGLVFANALGGEFVWDDKPMIVENDHIRDLRHALHFFAPAYWEALFREEGGMRGRAYRPFAELCFAVQYRLWGLNPVGWHITSVILHAANCALVYLLACGILGDRRVATISALLFATHPLHVEAVAWAKAQSELLSVLLMLASLLLYLRYLEASPGTGRGWVPYLCSLAACALALLSKASAAVLPVLLGLYVWCFVPRARWRPALVALLPHAALVGAFFALSSLIPTVQPAEPLAAREHLLTVLGTVGTYLRLLLAPVGLCLHHPKPVAGPPWTTEMLAGLLLVLALTGAMVLALRRSRVALFALAWLVLEILPVSNIRPLVRPIGEVRAYGPSIGFCLLLAAGLCAIKYLPSLSWSRPRLGKRSLIVAVLVVAMYSGLTLARNAQWRDNLTLWHDTIGKNPDSAHAHRYLSEIYETRGEMAPAIHHMRRVTEIHPRHVWALGELGRLCAEAGRDDEAIAAYERLLQIEGSNVTAHVTLGGLYAMRGRSVEAIDHLRAALRYDPRSAEAYTNLGSLYILQERHTEALAELQHAVRLAPDDASIRHGLGVAYAGLGRHEDALREYREALTGDSTRARTWLAMGECYETLGRTGPAVRAYRRCEELPGPLADVARQRLESLIEAGAVAPRSMLGGDDHLAR